MFVQLTKEFLGKPVGERIDVADADADQLIRQGWAQPIEHDLLTPTITRAVQSGLDDAVERSLQSWLRRQPTAKRVPFAGLGDAALDDPKAGFKHFGEFALAVRDACQPGKRPDDRLALITKTASGMGENTGADGGFLVPAEFVHSILQRVYANTNLLGMTDSYTVSSNVIAFPRKLVIAQVPPATNETESKLMSAPDVPRRANKASNAGRKADATEPLRTEECAFLCDLVSRCNRPRHWSSPVDRNVVELRTRRTMETTNNGSLGRSRTKLDIKEDTLLNRAKVSFFRLGIYEPKRTSLK
jgi:hypothetical protein